MSNKTLLSIDCGTQSLRALLFSSTGDLLARKQIEYDPYFSVKPGWAEQDPEVFWNSLCQACLQLQADAPAGTRIRNWGRTGKLGGKHLSPVRVAV